MTKHLLLTLFLTGSLTVACWAQTPRNEGNTNKPKPRAAKQQRMSSSQSRVKRAVERQDIDPATVQLPDTKAEVAAIQKTAEQAAADQVAVQAAVAAAQSEDAVAGSDEVKKEKSKPAARKGKGVMYNPTSKRDPTLSPDDILLLQHREQMRLAAIEAERQRKLAEERRLREEAERRRQLELARIKDPTREVRNKISIGGIVGQEVFIGDKVYTVGNSVFGARIVEIRPDKVVFLYKGHKFVREMK